MLDQAANVVIHRFQHSRVDFHPSSKDFALLAGLRFPFPERGMEPRSRSVATDQAKFLCLGNAICLQCLPAILIDAFVVRGELLRGLHGDVYRLKSDIGKERFALVRLAQIFDRFVDEELGRIEIFRQVRWLAVLKPRRFVVVRHVGFVFPVVRTRCVERERSVEAV